MLSFHVYFVQTDRRMNRQTDIFGYRGIKIELTKNLINSLPHNKILDWSKLKAFADDKN